MGNSLRLVLPAIPPCPPVTAVASDDMSALVRTRNELQEWLSAVMVYPGSCEAADLRSFLTEGANRIPTLYESVSWTQFNTILPPPRDSIGNGSSVHAAGELDDMDMDDMYYAGDDGDIRHDEHNYDDDGYIPSASVRFKPTDEAVTDADEMELLDLAGEVEMIEDIGSLAQSYGACHLGRSLQLQAEMTQQQQASMLNNRPTQGLQIGGVVNPAPTVGGIGGAMARAAESNNSSTAFNGRALQSAPRLDSFKLIKVIGKGSFGKLHTTTESDIFGHSSLTYTFLSLYRAGKVFLVKEHNTGNIHALKVLRKDNIIKRNQVEHTRTERSVLGYVRHPFIVGMNMAFQSKDKLYFVLDYCAGGELFFHLGKVQKFPEPRARFYAAEIVLAISYVHSLDIIYRDLKPENVLLDAEGHIRLTDFGLSKEGISSSSSGANSFCGTPEYLAPEILNRQGHGRAVDWWSLGALLYEMLTSLPPFYCQDRQRLFEKIRNSELSYPASISRVSVSVLQGLLTKDPNKRLGSGPKDAEEIEAHAFFEEIDWVKLGNGEVEPPWRPDISGSLDTSQFDSEFTNMPVFSPQSLRGMHGFGTIPADNPFEGFTFTDRRLCGPGAEARM
jgi:serine/threonine protein kinase